MLLVFVWSGAAVVVVVRGNNLKDVGGLGRMDPYVEVTYGPHTQGETSKKSKTRKGS